MYLGNRLRFKSVKSVLLISLLVFALIMPGGIFHPNKAKAASVVLSLCWSVGFEVGGYILDVYHDPDKSFEEEGFCDAVAIGVAEGLLHIGIVRLLSYASHSERAYKLSQILNGFGIDGPDTLQNCLAFFDFIDETMLLNTAIGMAEVKKFTLVFEWIEKIKDEIKQEFDCTLFSYAQQCAYQLNPFSCWEYYKEFKYQWENEPETWIFQQIQDFSLAFFEEHFAPSLPEEELYSTDIILGAMPVVSNADEMIQDVYMQDEQLKLTYNINLDEEWCESIDIHGLGSVVIEIFVMNDGERQPYETCATIPTYKCNIGNATRVLYPSELLTKAGIFPNEGGTIQLGAVAYAYGPNQELLDKCDSGILYPITFAPADNKPYLSNPSIWPSNPTTSDNITFSVQYNDEDGDPVDDGSVKVAVDGNQIAMSGSSNESGAIFTSARQIFSEGTHNYYFIGTQSGEQFRYPSGSSTLNFNVTEDSPDGLSISADPPSITICGSESSQITATLTNGGNPVEGQEVAFVILEGDGYLSQTTDDTNSQGKAFTTFTPDSIGTTTIGAVVNGLPVAQTDVVISGCDVNIAIGMYLDDCDETTSTYKIEARITDSSSGDAIQNEDVTVRVKKPDGNYFGDLWDYDDNTGNPLSTSTDNYGDIDVFLDISESRDVLVTVECMGSTKVIQNYVYAGCVPPTEINAFTEIPISPNSHVTNAISVSPDGNKLAAVSEYYILIYDIENWKKTGEWVPWLTLKQPDNSPEYALSVAWSPNGSYLAAGFDDPKSSERPGLMVWNTGESPSDFTIKFMRMTNDTYEDVLSLCWSPDSNYIMTGEALNSAGDGGRARIWNLSGTNTKIFPQGDDDVNAVAWSITNYKAIGFNGDGRVWIYNSSNSMTADFATYSDEQVYSLEWNPAGNRVAVGIDNAGAHSPINIYDTNGNQTGSFSEHAGMVYGLAWHPTIGKVASCGLGDNIIKIWNSSGALLQSFGSAGFTDVLWSPDGGVLFAASYNPGKIYVYALNDSIGPTITIQDPPNNSQTTSNAIIVSGSIIDAHLVNTASIIVNNGTPETLAIDESNTFSKNVFLAEGQNTVTIEAEDGSGNTSSHSITIERIILNPNFSLSLSPSIRTVGVGEDATYTISLLSIDGFNSSVTLSLSGIPQDTVSSFSSNPVTPTASLDLMLTPSTSTPLGLHEITIEASGGGKTHSTTFDLIVTAPEINVRQAGIDLPDGTGSFNFGNLCLNSGQVITFTIENIGDGSLNLMGSPAVQISGINAVDFEVIAQPSISVAELGTTTFEISFTPSGVGVRSATVSIANSDSDENPYDFEIKGNGEACNIIPAINSIIPLQGSIGTQITIDGINFGTEQGSSYVTFFNGIFATNIISWSDTQISCTVPVGAKTGCVMVTTDNGGSNCFTFNVFMAREGDFDTDGDVDGTDLFIFSYAYAIGDLTADLDNSGNVDANDLVAFAADYGSIGEGIGFTPPELIGNTFQFTSNDYPTCVFDLTFINDHQFVGPDGGTYNYIIENGSIVINDPPVSTTISVQSRNGSIITASASVTGGSFEDQTDQWFTDFSGLNNSASALKDWFIANGFWLGSTITTDGHVTNEAASFDGDWRIEDNVFYFDYPEDDGCVDYKAYKLVNDRLMFATDADATYTYTMVEK